MAWRLLLIPLLALFWYPTADASVYRLQRGEQVLEIELLSRLSERRRSEVIDWVESRAEALGCIG